MIPALLWTAAGIIFAVEVTVIVALIVRNKPAQTGKASEPADLERIGGMLAEAREDLTEPESWPVRQTPTDLQAAYEDVPPPWPWRSLPLEPGLETHFHLYRSLGVVDPARSSDTQEFNLTFDAIISTAFADGWKCDSCAVGRDGEDQHVSCPGCACHCGDSQGAQVVHIGEPGRNAWMEAA